VDAIIVTIMLTIIFRISTMLAMMFITIADIDNDKNANVDKDDDDVADVVFHYDADYDDYDSDDDANAGANAAPNNANTDNGITSQYCRFVAIVRMLLAMAPTRGDDDGDDVTTMLMLMPMISVLMPPMTKLASWRW